MTDQNNQQFKDKEFHAQDDVPIYYRDYGDPMLSNTPVLCLGGLTRNSRDFAKLANRLSPSRRVLCMDYRGRGRSGRDPDWRNYQPKTYVGDVVALLAIANVQRAIVIGTSLGGIVAMGLGAAIPTALAGVVLNDVGPEIDAKGLNRIKGYVGSQISLPTLEAAAEVLKTQFGGVFADFSQQDWLDYADATFAKDATAGAYQLDYDMRICDAMRVQAEESLKEPPDIWALFASLARIPVLAIRGALSDILSQATLDRMQQRIPELSTALVPNRGHVPQLNEPECVAAIDRFLTRVDAREASLRQ
jgi:pimeloyl-ACP methyl ester carboxylesterase